MASKAEVRTYRVPYEGSTVDLAVEERGEGGGGGGKPFLLLHGGVGPASMARFSGLLAERHQARVLTPTHPGFACTGRSEALNTVKGLARVYAEFLGGLGATDVTVVGNSIGGWIAAELALLAPPQLSSVVLVSAAGIEVAGHEIPDVSKLTLEQVMSLSYYDPKPFRIDPAALTEGQRAAAACNRGALQVYAPRMTDTTLAARLAYVRLPVLSISGEADRVVPAEYGRAFAAAIPGAKFELLARTGHVSQVESPELLLDTIWSFLEDLPASDGRPLPQA